MDHQALANLLFPDVNERPDDFEELYPARHLPENAMVTRLGPSPTGFIHLGNLYGAFVDERLAHQSGGVFYLRLEDTDDKRSVEGAREIIIDSLDFFGIHFDEGVRSEGEIGDYGPYVQSNRTKLYQAHVKELIRQGLAYPCFLTEEEIASIRADQEAAKKTPGIYGRYASCRDLSLDAIRENIRQKKPYVIRLRSQGNPDDPKEITITDGIRGQLTMPENSQDVVILKQNGIPTYHFAHVCDDHYMRTTHVVRGEEWLSSLPIHVELFFVLGFDLPIYCHTAVLMKLDEQGNKRKLSKRKDPELSLDFYKKQGYHPQAVSEYLLTLLNSNYEEWRSDHPDSPLDDFPFSTEKMSTSGALFDLNKLNDVSRDTLARIPADELSDFLRKWARDYRPELTDVLADDMLLAILDLGRHGKKPRKDFICASQMFDHISYFYDDYFHIEDELPVEAKDDAKAILTAYLDTYDHSDDNGQWFEKIRHIADQLGYAVKPKDYKKNPEKYKGHVGHVSTVIRIALMGRSQSPDIWEIQQILGEERTRQRIEQY